MKIIVLHILVLFLINQLYASEIKKNTIYTVDEKLNFFTIDHLNRTYTVDKNNTITIYDKDGKKLYSANFNISGKLSSIDASDPMKLHLFYNDVSKVIVTDNQLNIIRSYDFQNKLLHFTAGCRTDNGKIVVYDIGEQKLKAFNYNLQLEFESRNFYSFANQSIDPVQIQYFDGKIFVNDPLNGIYVFDRFGTYVQTIDFKLIESFYIWENKIYFIKNGSLFAFDIKNNQKIGIDIDVCDSELKIKQFIIANNRIYCLTEKQLIINQIN